MAANMQNRPLTTEFKTSVQNPSDFIKREEGFSDHITIKAEPLDPSYDEFETHPLTSEPKHNHCPLLVPQADSNDFPIEVKQECDDQDGTSQGCIAFLQHSQIKVQPEDGLMAETDADMTEVEDEATDEMTEYDDGSAPEEEYYESEGLDFQEDTSDLDPPMHKRLKISQHSRSLHKCSHCQKLFDKQDVLGHHLYKVSAGRNEPHSCHKCGENVKCRTHLWAHLLTHQGQMAHICKDCGMVFKTEEGVKKHMLCKHFQDDHTCEFCQKRFESMLELVNHLLTHRGVSEPQYKCLVCSETFERKDDLQKHLLTHNNNVFVCKVCLKAFDTKDNLTTHNCDVLCCNLCLMTFTSEQQLRNHRSLHNISGGDSVCPKCGKAFAMKYKYFKHIRECYEDGPFPCEGCNELFEKRSELTQHLQSKHACKELYLGKGSSLETGDIVVNRGFHKIKCSRCSKTFKYQYMFSKHKIFCLKEGKDSRVQCSSSSDLSVNQKTRLYKYDRHTMLLKRNENESKNSLSQTNDTASTCKLSQKSLESIESLTMQNCDLEQCSVCLMTFSSKVQLEDHMKFHNISEGEKVCLECGKIFVTSVEKSRHMKDYHKLRSFRCKKCLAVFQNGTELLLHKESVHARQREYYCRMCSLEFPTLADLRDHQMNDVGKCKDSSLETGDIIVNYGDYKIKCDGCTKTFKSQYIFSEHKKKCLKDGTNSSMLSSSSTDLAVNQKTRLYKYDRHTMLLKKKEDESKNLLSHTSDKALTCKLCLKTFESKESLTMHNCDLEQCSVCLMIFSSKEKLEDHMKLHNISEGQKLCLECGKIFVTSAEKYKHMRDHKLGSFHCKNCLAVFQNGTELMLHNESVHASQKVYFCRMCSHEFPTLADWKEHQMNDEGKCSFCSRQFTSHILLFEHMKHCHKTEDNLHCSSLSDVNTPRETHENKNSGWKKKLPSPKYAHSKHTKEGAEGTVKSNSSPDLDTCARKLHLCTDCGLEFGSPAYLASHKKTHVYKCYNCMAAFESKEMLWKHMEMCCKECCCRDCNMQFSSLAKLVAHQMTHTHRCDCCTMMFGSEDVLSKHMEVCTKKPCLCTECNLEFGSWADMVAHRLQCHEYKCDKCSKIFHSRADLKEHRGVKETVYDCLTCGLGFKIMNEMVKHSLDAHNNTRPFRCEYCGERFRGKMNLTLHWTKSCTKVKKCSLLSRTMPCGANNSQCHGNVCSAVGKSIEQCSGKANATFKDKVEEELEDGCSPENVFMHQCDNDCNTPGMASALHVVVSDNKNDVGNVIEKKVIQVNSIEGKNVKQYCRKDKSSLVNRQDHNAELESELSSHAWNDESNKKEPEEHTNNIAVTCKLCLKTFESSQSLSTHNCNLEQCTICLMTFSSKVQLEDHMKFHNISEGEKVCLECGKIFVTSAKKYKHMKDYHKLGSFQCKKCLTVFQNGTELMLHNESVHASQIVYFCRMCTLEFPTLADWKEHQMNDEGKCSFCLRQFTSHILLFEHMKYCDKKHPEGNLQSSSSSDVNTLGETHENKDGGWKKKLQPPKYAHSKHIKEGAEGTVKSNSSSDLATYVRKIHLCTDCGLEFNSPAYLASHKKTHVYKCYNCMTAFESKEMLSKHMEMCCKECCCTDCNMQFSSLAELVAHQMTHTHRCDCCMMKFGSEDVLSKHMNICTKKPCLCTECSLEFGSWADMVAHRLQCHEYKCDKCSKSFHSRADLKDHRGVKETIYDCLTCGLGFKIMSEMVKHSLDAHNNTRPFRCEYCGKRFRRKLNVTLHWAKSCTKVRKRSLLSHTMGCGANNRECNGNVCSAIGKSIEQCTRNGNGIFKGKVEKELQDSCSPENVFMQQCDNDCNTAGMASALHIGVSDNKDDGDNQIEKKVIQANGIAEKKVKQYCRKEKSSLGNRHDHNAELESELRSRAWNDESNKKRARENVRQYGRKARNSLANTVVKKEAEDVISGNENSLTKFTSDATMLPVVKTEPDEIGIENSVTQYVTGGEEETMAMPTVKIGPGEAVSEHAPEQGSVADTLQSFNSHSAVFVQNANNITNLLPDNKVAMKVLLKKQDNGGATDGGVAKQFVVVIRRGEATASAAIANCVETSTDAEEPETEIIVPD